MYIPGVWIIESGFKRSRIYAAQRKFITAMAQMRSFIVWRQKWSQKVLLSH